MNTVHSEAHQHQLTPLADWPHKKIKKKTADFSHHLHLGSLGAQRRRESSQLGSPSYDLCMGLPRLATRCVEREVLWPIGLGWGLCIGKIPTGCGAMLLTNIQQLPWGCRNMANQYRNAKQLGETIPIVELKWVENADEQILIRCGWRNCTVSAMEPSSFWSKKNLVNPRCHVNVPELTHYIYNIQLIYLYILYFV